jgi:DNA invertase Pin-like site-specific DNA recombinase
LQQALDYAREGDVLVVWRLDRLGRSPKYLIEVITTLNERRIGFRSLTAQIDTTTSGGKLILHVSGALAELERDVIREHTQARLAAARAGTDRRQAEEAGNADEDRDGEGTVCRQESHSGGDLHVAWHLARHNIAYVTPARSEMSSDKES